MVKHTMIVGMVKHSMIVGNGVMVKYSMNVCNG